MSDIISKSSHAAGVAPLSSIYIPADRMREDTPEVRRYIDEELCPSLQEYGFIQPPVLKHHDPPLVADGTFYSYELISGWCRTQAAKALGLESIPFVFRRDLRPDQLKELELEENLRRKDFTWQEVCLGIYTTHRTKQLNAHADKQQWGVRQTGALLKRSVGYVQDAITIAKAILEGNEAVKSAANFSQACQMIYGQKEDAALARLASLSGATPSAKPRLSTPSMGPITGGNSGISLASALSAPTRSANEPVGVIPQSTDDAVVFDLNIMLFNMDNREWFDQQPDDSIDFIYTDIPFGIDMDNLDFNAADLDRVVDAHDVEENLEQMPIFFKNAYRTLKPSSYLIFWYDICHHEKTLAWLKETGFAVQPYPLVWCKEHPCRNRAGGKWWTKAVEYVMVAAKGTATLRAAQTRNWYLADGSAERKMQRNPFSKPFEISKKIIEAVCIPGMTMVDPYAGEGSLVRAGLNLGMRIKAIEKETHHFNGLMEHVKQTCSALTRGKATFQWSSESAK